jgi:hypothetical protein
MLLNSGFQKPTLLQGRRDGSSNAPEKIQKVPSGKDLMQQQKLNFVNASKSVEKPSSSQAG